MVLIPNIYSTADVGNATVCCFLHDQEISFDPKVKIYPDVLFQLSMNLAQFLSV